MGSQNVMGSDHGSNISVERGEVSSREEHGMSETQKPQNTRWYIQTSENFDYGHDNNKTTTRTLWEYHGVNE